MNAAIFFDHLPTRCGLCVLVRTPHGVVLLEEANTAIGAADDHSGLTRTNRQMQVAAIAARCSAGPPWLLRTGCQPLTKSRKGRASTAALLLSIFWSSGMVHIRVVFPSISFKFYGFLPYRFPADFSFQVFLVPLHRQRPRPIDKPTASCAVGNSAFCL